MLDTRPIREVTRYCKQHIRFIAKQNIQFKNRLKQNKWISAPGAGPVTSNNIFGFRTDILLQLLNIKARRAYPGTQNISDIVPMLLKHLYETMEKNDTSVSCTTDKFGISPYHTHTTMLRLNCFFFSFFSNNKVLSRATLHTTNWNGSAVSRELFNTSWSFDASLFWPRTTAPKSPTQHSCKFTKETFSQQNVFVRVRVLITIENCSLFSQHMQQQHLIQQAQNRLMNINNGNPRLPAPTVSPQVIEID